MLFDSGAYDVGLISKDVVLGLIDKSLKEHEKTCFSFLASLVSKLNSIARETLLKSSVSLLPASTRLHE